MLGQQVVYLRPSSKSSSGSNIFSRGYDWMMKTLHLSSSSNAPQPEVNVDNQKIPVSIETLTEVPDQNGEPLLRLYSLPTSVIRIYAPQHGVEILYDGYRVKLQVCVELMNCNIDIYRYIYIKQM